MSTNYETIGLVQTATSANGEDQGFDVNHHPIPDYGHYASLGFGVFPIKTGTKNTSFDGWQNLALYGADTARIYWYSGHFPHYTRNHRNVGLALDGLVVVDVDVNHGDGKDGFKSKAEMEADYGELPQTRAHKSPRGGVQYIYLADPDRPMKSRPLHEAKYPGIDIKASRGARILCPGSVTEHGVYSVESDHEIAAMPEWLYDVQEASKPTNRYEVSATAAPHPSPEDTPEGIAILDQKCAELAGCESGRNNLLNNTAMYLGHLVHEGKLIQSTVEQALRHACRSGGDGGNGLADEDGLPSVDKTIQSGLNAGIKTPRSKLVEDTAAIHSHLYEVKMEDSATNIVSLADAVTGDAEQATEVEGLPHVVAGSGSGWLARGTGGQIVHQASIDDPDNPKEKKVVWMPWADFDIHPVSKNVDTEGNVDSYTVNVIRHRGELPDLSDQILPVGVLTNSRELTHWLAVREVSICPSGYDVKAAAESRGVRLLRYLTEQRPPVGRMSGWYGPDPRTGAFLTPSGVITEKGLVPFTNVRPHPDLRRIFHGESAYNYGFDGDPEEARRVLREVLTFQNRTTASVFGAWWAAALIKDRIMKKTSLFPYMEIEATSGSGKTNGFFGLMLQLNGSQGGQSDGSRASVRDVVAGHRAGIVWIDDPDKVEHIQDLLRQATSEGLTTKKDNDNRSNVNARLVAPIVLSGEGFGHDGEKAMRDRAVRLAVPPAKSRHSLHDRTRRQWDDIVALTDQYPDLTVLAGHLVQSALSNADVVDQLPVLRPRGSGRHTEKLAILRVGARILSAMTGDSVHVRLVDKWIEQQVDLGEENTLTLSIIPRLLSAQGLRNTPERIDKAPYFGIATPVIEYPHGDDRALWVNVKSLADWWARYQNGKIRERTDTEQALRAQLAALGCKSQKAGKNGEDWIKVDVEGAPTRERPVYVRLPDDVCERLLEDYEECPPATAVNVTSIRKLTANQASAVRRSS